MRVYRRNTLYPDAYCVGNRDNNNNNINVITIDCTATGTMMMSVDTSFPDTRNDNRHVCGLI